MKRLEAVIFDWAGTTVDFGSLAPVRALSRLFATQDIPLTDADVRRDMGLFKKDHIRRILAMPHVHAAWQRRHGHTPEDGEIDALFAIFSRLQMETLEELGPCSTSCSGTPPSAVQSHDLQRRNRSSRNGRRLRLVDVGHDSRARILRLNLSHVPRQGESGRGRRILSGRSPSTFRLRSNRA